MSQGKMDREDNVIQEFVQAVTSSLLAGKKYPIPGFGTFSTCSRKDESGQPVCKIAMFRASSELRDFSTGGPSPTFTGPHAVVVSHIVENMQNEGGVDIPLLGQMVCEPVKGKNTKFIYRGALELNNALS